MYQLRGLLVQGYPPMVWFTAWKAEATPSYIHAGLISVYLSVVPPQCQERSILEGGGGHHGCTGLINHCGMYKRMYAARVLNICSLCYSVVPTIGGVHPPHHAKLVHIYLEQKNLEFCRSLQKHGPITDIMGSDPCFDDATCIWEIKP